MEIIISSILKTKDKAGNLVQVIVIKTKIPGNTMPLGNSYKTVSQVYLNFLLFLSNCHALTPTKQTSEIPTRLFLNKIAILFF